MTRTVLPNGLRVLAVRHDRLPTFSLALSFESGSRCDGPAKSGLASLVAGILLEGAESGGGAGPAARIESSGAALDVAVGYETCVLSLTGLAGGFTSAVEALGEVVRSPRFGSRQLEWARRKQLAEIADEDDDPFLSLRREFLDLVYGDDPRGRPTSGRPESVKELRLEDAAAFHGRRFGPSRAVLAVSGDLQPEDVEEAVLKTFGDWQPAEASLSQGVPSGAGAAGVRFVRMERNQTHIIVGGPGLARTDGAYYAASVMDVVLGDSAGFGCRLGRRLRESDGLAYVVESDTTSSAGRDPGVSWTYTATSPAHADRALDAVLEEIDRLRAEPPSEQEVAHAVTYLIGRRRLDGETNEARAHRLVCLERFGLGLDLDERYESIMRGICVSDVAEAADRLLAPTHRSVAVAGPRPPTRFP